MPPYRVLVADDCQDEATILCEGLFLNNYQAVAVYNGTDALERSRQGDIDLILLDVSMPDITGYEVCEQLKQDPQTRDIPVIFVTAKGTTDDVKHGYSLGAVDYIAKPYNLPMVIVRVESVMRTRQMDSNSHEDREGLVDNVYTDQLTGLRNRRFMMERLQEELDKSIRYQYPVSCVVLDVEDVIAMDEEAGASSLDDLLVEIAMTMRACSRSYDILARYDGAMFVAVLSHASLQDSICYANKVQEEVSSSIFTDPSFPTQVSLSFGIVCSNNGALSTAEGMLGEAMQRLFRAKSQNGQSIHAEEVQPAR